MLFTSVFTNIESEVKDVCELWKNNILNLLISTQKWWWWRYLWRHNSRTSLKMTSKLQAWIQHGYWSCRQPFSILGKSSGPILPFLVLALYKRASRPNSVVVWAANPESILALSNRPNKKPLGTVGPWILSPSPRFSQFPLWNPHLQSSLKDWIVLRQRDLTRNRIVGDHRPTAGKRKPL